MSLINKMLRDIESRQHDAVAAPSPVQRPVYQDLRSAPAPRAGALVPLVVGIVAIVAVGGGGFYAWDKWGRSDVTQSAPATAHARTGDVPAKATTPAPSATVPAAVAATVPIADAPASEARPSIAAVPPPAVAVPADPEPSKTAVAIAIPQPEPGANATSIAPVREDKTAKIAPQAPAIAPAPVARQATKPKPSADAAAEREPANASVDKRIRPFTPEESAESAYRKAVRYVDQGRSDEAARELTDALRAFPQHTGARELLAGLSLKHGRWREAQQLLEEGMAHSPKHYAFAQILARVHIDHGAEQKALALLEAAAPLAANDPNFTTLLATVYQRAGRHADAVAAFGQVVELRPAEARAWLGLAISLEAEQKAEPARRAYERAQQLGGLPSALAKYVDKRLAALRGSE